MIALVTTCKGRAQHLKQTLPKNMADNPEAKFVVLDYGSGDDLLPWIAADSQCCREITAGRLVIYHLLDAGNSFHMAHAKNVAHRVGILEGADILVNVDADNFTGPGFADWVRLMMGDLQSNRLFTWAGQVKGRGRRFRGTSGRIGMSKTAFLLTGGYDEVKYADWGPDDKDMNERLKMLGFQGIETPPEYLSSVPHTDGLRFKEYPHAKCESDEMEVNPCRAVVNNGRFGCGVVYRNFDFTRPITLGPLPTRIFGIGMHKTATRSLDRALKILGYDSAHWEGGGWARDILNEMLECGRSITVEKSYCLSDLPIPLLYKELDKAYPGSKFILTIKSEEQWLRSVCNHWKYEINPYRWEWDQWPISNRIHRMVYGQAHYDALVFLQRYRRHNEEVIEYFRNRPDDLCIMHMDEGAGWPELCSFLRREVPAIVYPNIRFTMEC